MNNPECTFYIVRHGETEWNIQKRMLSYTDISMSEQGIIQIQDLAEMLSNIEFTAIYTSDLTRTQTTADMIKRSRTIPIYQTPKLREKNFGILEGKSVIEVTELMSEYSNMSHQEVFHFKFDQSMESDSEASERILSFLSQMTPLHEAPSFEFPDAVNIRMDCFTAVFSGELIPSSEIEEMQWFTHDEKQKTSPVDQVVFDYLRRSNLII